MSDRPKPGGYRDRAALARGRAASRRLAELAGQLLRPVSRTEQLVVLAQISLKIAEQGEALSEMALIRERWVAGGKKGGAGGE